jgi:uncharacterized protein
MKSVTTIAVNHNVAANRFDAHVGAEVAIAEYRLTPGTITFTHTFVPPGLSNRGIASQLIAAGLKMAREHDLKVVSQCQFVSAYMRRHPEVQDLLTEEGRRSLNCDAARMLATGK